MFPTNYSFIYIYIYIYVLQYTKSGLHFSPIGSDEVLLKIILEFLIHINALNRMEISLLS